MVRASHRPHAARCRYGLHIGVNRFARGFLIGLHAISNGFRPVDGPTRCVHQQKHTFDRVVFGQIGQRFFDGVAKGNEIVAKPASRIGIADRKAIDQPRYRHDRQFIVFVIVQLTANDVDKAIRARACFFGIVPAPATATQREGRDHGERCEEENGDNDKPFDGKASDFGKERHAGLLTFNRGLRPPAAQRARCEKVSTPAARRCDIRI